MAPSYAQITKVDVIQDTKSSKVIIHLSKKIESKPLVNSTPETVSFELDSIYEPKKKLWSQNQESLATENLITSDDFISKLQWKSSLNKTAFEIKRKHYSPVNITLQEKPPLLVLEFPKNYFDKETEELKPGITKHLIRTVNKRGPITAHVLEIDLSVKNISVKVGLPDKKKIKSKDTLTNIVKNEMAFAGINANYFDVKLGNPLGTLITDSTWLTGPVYDRVAIGFSKDKEILINQVMLIGNVTVFRGFRKKPYTKFEIDGLNTPFHLYKKAGFYTVNWGEELKLPENKIALIVKENCIKKILKDSIDIPEEGYVLASDNNYVLSSLKKKDCIKIDWESTPDWSNVTEAVSGGPYLTMNSDVYVDELKQKFKFAIKDTYAPRSAVGIGKNNNLYLIAVDGRRNNHSVGLTLKELADFLKNLDLKEAINLDGGGSTTLVAGGKIINTLSERHERKISNALLIFYKN